MEEAAQEVQQKQKRHFGIQGLGNSRGGGEGDDLAFMLIFPSYLLSGLPIYRVAREIHGTFAPCAQRFPDLLTKLCVCCLQEEGITLSFQAQVPGHLPSDTEGLIA